MKHHTKHTSGFSAVALCGAILLPLISGTATYATLATLELRHQESLSKEAPTPTPTPTPTPVDPIEETIEPSDKVPEDDYAPVESESPKAEPDKDSQISPYKSEVRVTSPGVTIIEAPGWDVEYDY